MPDYWNTLIYHDGTPMPRRAVAEFLRAAGLGDAAVTAFLDSAAVFAGDTWTETKGPRGGRIWVNDRTGKTTRKRPAGAGAGGDLVAGVTPGGGIRPAGGGQAGGAAAANPAEPQTRGERNEARRQAQAQALAAQLAQRRPGEIDPESVAGATLGLGMKHLGNVRRELFGRTRKAGYWQGAYIQGQKTALLDALAGEHAEAVSGQDGFIDAILADPDDVTNRAVFSDWLEEHDRPVAAGRVRELTALAATAAGMPLPAASAPSGGWDYLAIAAGPARYKLEGRIGQKAVDLHTALAIRHMPLASGGTLWDQIKNPLVKRAATLCGLHWAGVVGDAEVKAAIDAAGESVRQTVADANRMRGHDDDDWRQPQEPATLAALTALTMLASGPRINRNRHHDNLRDLRDLEVARGATIGEAPNLAGTAYSSEGWAVSLARALPALLAERRPALAPLVAAIDRQAA